MFGEQIKNRRKELGFTQKHLADLLGVAEVTVRQYEANRRIPSLDMCINISNVLGIPLEVLLGSTKTASDIILSIRQLENELDCQMDILYNKLNKTGKLEAVKRVGELTQLPQYTEREEKETPSEGK